MVGVFIWSFFIFLVVEGFVVLGVWFVVLLYVRFFIIKRVEVF